MAKRETGNKPGKDSYYYETSSGVVFAPAYMSNGITGTPPMPGLRGGPDDPGTGRIGTENSAKDSGVPSQFFSKAND